MSKLQLKTKDNIAKLESASFTKKEQNDIFKQLIILGTDNPELLECDHNSLLNSAMKATSLNLPLDNNKFYVIPFFKKGEKKKQAQFQAGINGLKWQAISSGNVVLLNDFDIREGEVLHQDVITGITTLKQIDDPFERKKKKIIGYGAYIKLKDGFEKTLFMTKDEVIKHHKEYSQAYKKNGKFIFDEEQMNRKVVMKKLLKQYGGDISKDLQETLRLDQAVINDDGEPEYIDNPKSKMSAFHSSVKPIVEGKDTIIIENNTTLITEKQLKYLESLLSEEETKTILKQAKKKNLSDLSIKQGVVILSKKLAKNKKGNEEDLDNLSEDNDLYNENGELIENE